MADRRGPSMKATARILRGESRVSRAALEVLSTLTRASASTLRANGFDPALLDSRMPGWRTALEDVLLPTIRDVYEGGWRAEIAAGTIEASPYATRHMEAVWNRLVNVSDEVFDTMRLTLDEGRQAGEDIRQLSRRVDALLGDTQRWKNRATVIARTEVIAANNAGQRDAAGAVADVAGHARTAVVKEWLATHDRRTRESHIEADGQVVLGLDGFFTVGSSSLAYPGDPSGAAREVVQCRCTALYHYPGDPDYAAKYVEAGGVAPTEAPAVAPSMFTPEQLTQALDPTRRRSASAITKELAATSAGRDLTAAIKGFTETRGGVANLRKNIAATVDGSASKAVEGRTRAFLDAMNTYPRDQVPPLYRGVAVKVTDTAEWWDSFEAQFQVGQRINLNASSFSASEKKAAEFQSMIGGTRKASGNHTAVRLVLEDGPAALPVESLSKFKSEREWITGGDFEVVGYTPASKAQPYYRVVIRQIARLEAP